MSKVYTFIIIMPFMLMVLFKSITFFEQETKQRYIKDLADNLVDDVRITGVLTHERYNEFLSRINTFSLFENEGVNMNRSKGVLLRKGAIVDGTIQGVTGYSLGEQLQKGSYFMIYLQSSEPTNFSKMENWGVSQDDTDNFYYKARAECRVEYVEIMP